MAELTVEDEGIGPERAEFEAFLPAGGIPPITRSVHDYESVKQVVLSLNVDSDTYETLIQWRTAYVNY